MTIPYVIEQGSDDQERMYDLYSRLLKDRIIFIRGMIDQDSADSVVAQLLFLESTDKESDITMYINSPGGEVSAMYSIFDTMGAIGPDISTLGLGTCASAASFLLASGTKGKRTVLPHTQIMIHELAGGYAGKAGEMRNHFKHLEYLYELMAEHYVEMTGQKIEKVKLDMTKDYYMTAKEAIKYGLVDKIQGKRK